MGPLGGFLCALRASPHPSLPYFLSGMGVVTADSFLRLPCWGWQVMGGQKEGTAGDLSPSPPSQAASPAGAAVWFWLLLGSPALLGPSCPRGGSGSRFC